MRKLVTTLLLSTTLFSAPAAIAQILPKSSTNAAITNSTFTITSPASGATVSGTINITGTAGNTWKNVRAYISGWTPVSNNVTPAGNAYSIPVDTKQFPNGLITLSITAFSVPAGQSGGTYVTKTLTLAVSNTIASNGSCGASNGVPVSAAPTTALCSSGTASVVSGSGPWTWTCAGSGGGTTANCSAPVQTAAVGNGLGVFYWGSVSQTDGFGNWLGATMGVAGTFASSNSWAEFTGFVLGGSTLAEWATWENAAPGRIITVGQPPWAWGTGGNWSACASGAYDQYYTALAHTIVNSGIHRVDLRLAWEFDGNWTGYYPNGDYTNFVGCWQHAYNAVRAVDSATPHVISFDWNVTPGCCNYLDTNFWPGDQYVDYIGMDLYDVQTITSLNTQFSQITAFAKAHNKKVTFPEWGLWQTGSNNGQGDDPTYIVAMYNYFTNPNNNVAWNVYFDTATDANHQIDGATIFPNGAAKYHSLFQSYSTPVGVAP